LIQVVIAMTTFYKSVEELRFKLACQLVSAAVSAGHKVVIVDGSPTREVAKKLYELGAQVYPQLHKGMGPGRREVFFHAMEVAVEKDISFILWTEPEKVDVVRWVEKIIEPLLEDSSVVVPRRSEKAWATWPTYQRTTEEKANQVYNDVAKIDGFDPMLGLVAFHISVARYFVLCSPKRICLGNTTKIADTYIQQYASLIAHLLGEKTVKVEIDMVYPTEQRAEEEGTMNEEMLKKREWQMVTISDAFRIIDSVSKSKLIP